jgi:ribosomal protein S4E
LRKPIRGIWDEKTNPFEKEEKSKKERRIDRKNSVTSSNIIMLYKDGLSIYQMKKRKNIRFAQRVLTIVRTKSRCI